MIPLYRNPQGKKRHVLACKCSIFALFYNILLPVKKKLFPGQSDACPDGAGYASRTVSLPARSDQNMHPGQSSLLARSDQNMTGKTDQTAVITDNSCQKWTGKKAVKKGTVPPVLPSALRRKGQRETSLTYVLQSLNVSERTVPFVILCQPVILSFKRVKKNRPFCHLLTHVIPISRSTAARIARTRSAEVSRSCDTA